MPRPMNTGNPLFENSEELKKHLSCDFLPGDKVKIKGNPEDIKKENTHETK